MTRRQTPPLRPGYASPRAAPVAAPPTSWAAVTSLVLGLLACIPVVTGLGAIVFGWLGLRQTREGRGGRGLAIAGLVLGVISVLGWAGVGLGGWSIYRNSEGPRLAAEAFLTDLATGDVAAAQARSHPQMPPADLQAAADALAPRGGLTETSFSNTYVNSDSGQTTWRLGGTATFATGPTAFEVVVAPSPAGGYVVTWFNVR